MAFRVSSVAKRIVGRPRSCSIVISAGIGYAASSVRGPSFGRGFAIVSAISRARASSAFLGVAGNLPLMIALTVVAGGSHE
jgi:hypothetical protein